MRSVVVTGLGAVTPLGRSVEDSWAKLCAGRSGIRPITQFDVSGLRTRVAGQVPDFAPQAYMTAKLAGRVDRFVQLGVAAARQAVQHARLTVAGAEAERVAVVMGNTFAGVLLVEQGCEQVAGGEATMLSPFFVPGEGAGAVVLEPRLAAERRGAAILAELAGYGTSCDAFHLTRPDPSADGCARSMRLALEDAGLDPVDVDHVNAHGTSTRLNDAVEARAMHRVFGRAAPKVPLTANKSMLGHTIGAAGGELDVRCAERRGEPPGPRIACSRAGPDAERRSHGVAFQHPGVRVLLHRHAEGGRGVLADQLPPVGA